MSLRIACVGGGPGGLFFASLIKASELDAEITVFERKRPEDTFGFGVVFSDATLAGIHAVDPILRTALQEHGVHWDRIEVQLKGERWGCSGNGMAAIRRTTLLSLLQKHAIAAGVDIRFQTEVGLADLTDYDVIVAADGANSRLREQHADNFRPSYDTASAKFIWFGTTYPFEGLTFVHERGPDGVFAVHGYPIGDGLSTFIVETDEKTWRRAGLDEFDVTQPPGVSDLKSKEYLEKLFEHQIDGHSLVTNNSRWASFHTRRAARWHHGNLALLGDAAHTAHFSVGSGTKMAMEDAIALAAALQQHPRNVEEALSAYEAAARPSTEKIQASARPSLSWWEHFGRYHDVLEPWQFSFHFLTRAISVARLARRDPGYVGRVRDCWHNVHGSAPLSTRLRLDDCTVPQRVLDVIDANTLRAGMLTIPMAASANSSTSRPWALAVDAPEAESELPQAIRTMRDGLADRPDLVAVRGGARLPRVLLAEEARMAAGFPVVIVEDELTDDDAETLLLSGRADLVATSQQARSQWRPW
jgi:salicyloyl-CoA 5-hydroxylase